MLSIFGLPISRRIIPNDQISDFGLELYRVKVSSQTVDLSNHDFDGS
jgi:hypothetical protein